MTNKLGAFIRLKRGNESLRDLAKRCSVSHTLIDTLEKGYDPRTKKPARPTVDSLKKIALGLGVNVLELLVLAADEEYVNFSCPQNHKLLEIARKLENLPPEKQKALETLLELSEQDKEEKR